MTTTSSKHRVRYLRLHAGQQRAWDSAARFVFVLAGTQSGKTMFGPWWLAREIERQGQGDYIAVTASYDLFKLKMLPALRDCFENELHRGRYYAADRIMEIRDPATGLFRSDKGRPPYARIILRSAEAEGGLESSTASAAWGDELGQNNVTVETWEAILRRLSLKQGRVLCTTTPYNLGWLKTHAFDKWEAHDPLFDVIQFPSTNNPAFPQAEFDRAEATMPEWRFRMFYKGEFARPPGLVYDVYQEDRHMYEPFEVPAHWSRWAGVDFGAVNTATVWLAQHPDTGVYHLYHETHAGGLTTAQHAAQQLAHHAEAIWYGGAASEDQPRRDWSAAGVHVQRPPISAVESGIDRVIELFRTDRLRISRDCLRIRAELGSYRRKCDADGNVLEEILDKAKAHQADACRYACSGLDTGSFRVGASVWDPEPKPSLWDTFSEQVR